MVFDLAPFRSWLVNRNYSPATVRNYLADLDRYFDYLRQLPPANNLSLTASSGLADVLSSAVVESYVSHISANANYARYLSSLNLFCRFARDQHLISHNPVKKVKSVRSTPRLPDLLDRWEKHLTAHQTAPTTIRNYINDLNQYINWLNSASDEV